MEKTLSVGGRGHERAALAVELLQLEPADLLVAVPLWEAGVRAGDVGIAVIDGSAADWEAVAGSPTGARAELAAAPVVTVGVVRDGRRGLLGTGLIDGCDLVVRDAPADELDTRVATLIAQVSRAPGPALVAAQVLRGGDSRIETESFAYAMLLGGDSFRDWRGMHARGTAIETTNERVRIEEAPGAWIVRLVRPGRHNAFDSQMREALCDALDAVTSASSAPVVMVSDGPSFCSGGDLDEFGTASDPVTAHRVRTGRSVARRLERISQRLVVGVHGHCIGAGVELAAFARVVIATPSASFALPELSIGLNLGAGGTVSIPRRIGRHRTLEWLLTAEPVDTATAEDWGLVDQLVEPAELERHCLEVATSLARRPA